MRFVKMQGLGNDYVYVNGFDQRVEAPATLAVRIADRHFGVGGDGLILVLPPTSGVDAEARMRMFNADGSEAEMCGNGVRCVCKFVHDFGIATANPMRIETGSGVLTLSYTLDATGKVDLVTVNMGVPNLIPAQVPVEVASLRATGQPQTFVIPDAPAVPGLKEVAATFVSMGNPHATIYVPDAAAVNLTAVGSKLETHPAFPRRMNIHFVQVVSPDEVIMRTWERGSGITLACGTGASAVCVAGVLTGRTSRQLLAHLPGGDLRLDWREDDNHLLMTGPAVTVFQGDYPLG